VTLVDTGESTSTGGRLKRVGDYLKNEEAFCLTYGDGVADIDITALIAHHRDHRKAATVTAVQPPGRYGALDIDNGAVTNFAEKPPGDGGLINGGFFVLSPSVLDLIEGDHISWEVDTLQKLAAIGQLQAFHHRGFWQAMDTLRDKTLLETLWHENRAPWKVW
jgi:glucose-1-phosphate cytidylyltransferase